VIRAPSTGTLLATMALTALPPSVPPGAAARLAEGIARALVAVLPLRLTHPGGRAVDVVVPVHDAREHVLRCVASVQRHARGRWRLVLVDDASRDRELVGWLDEVARRDRRVVLLRNGRNRGFVASANLGLRNATGHDVVLLNSDTEVTRGFLGRLGACAYATPDTGLVSPLTNNGTICSIPRFCEANEIPPDLGVDELAALVRRASRRLRPELITAVGFCMYVRAEVIARIGYLDEESFGRGYGEENDYSLRARAAGFRVRLCDDLFIAHAGSASFGDSNAPGELAGNAAMGRLHPTYHDDVQRFIRENPLAAAREPILRALARAGHGASP
jgi:GT2 family glycosyltransferase